MVITIIVLSILIIIEFFILRNLYIQNQKYEKLLEDKIQEKELYKNHLIKLGDIIDKSRIRLMEIDKREAYSSDDEIGWFFNQVKTIQNELNNFIPKQ